MLFIGVGFVFAHRHLQARLLCWWRASVVMASVSDWRTFPDMCLIYG